MVDAAPPPPGTAPSLGPAPGPPPPGTADALPTPTRSPLLVVGALAAGALFATPFAYLLARALDDPTGVWAVVTSQRTTAPLWRTLQLGVLVTAASTVLGTGLAWLVIRTDLPGRRVWRAVVVLPLVIPSFVGANAFVAAFAPGGLLEELLGPLGIDASRDVRGLPAAFLVLTALSYPYVYLPVAARLAGLSPALEESARMLGRRPWAVFRTVVLPQAALAIGGGALLVLLYVISDFGAVQFVGFDTLTRRIYASRTLDPTVATGAGLLLAAVALAVTGIERAAARRNPPGVSLALRGARPQPLGRWRAPALAAVATVVGFALAAPVAVLGWWTFEGIRNPDARGPFGSVVGPTVSTAMVSVVTAVVAVAVVFPIARLTVRHRRASGGLAATLVVAGFALPGLVVALALVRLFVPTPLYGTYSLLVIAYVVHFGGQALRSSQAAVAAVPSRMEEAAQLLGAGRVRRLLSVELPLMRPALVAGGGLVLLNTMKELPITLLLSPLGHQALSTRVWQTAEQAYLYDAAVASLVLIALSGVLTWLLVIRRMEHLGR